MSDHRCNLNCTLTPAPAPPPEEACLRFWGALGILSSLGRDLVELQHCLNMILAWSLAPSTQYTGPGALQSANTLGLCFCQLIFVKVLLHFCHNLFHLLDSSKFLPKVATAAVHIISISALPIRCRGATYCPIRSHYRIYQHTTKLRK